MPRQKTVSWNCSWTLVGNPNPSLVVMVNFNSLLRVTDLDMTPEIMETVASFISVGLILFWYVIFSLIASTYSKDQGTSIAFGIGMWFLFTFLWALVTSMVAFASGVNVGEINNQEMIRIEGFLDLLSPNGVFHHLLETNLADVDRGVPDVISWLSALFFGQ